MTRAQEKLLRQRLHAEGRQSEPAFSPLLHERIMTALRESQSAPASQPVHSSDSPFRTFWRTALPLATAASLAVITWLLIQSPTLPDDTDTHVVDLPTPALPSDFVNPMRQFAPTATAFDQAKYAYLDRDAQRLATFVADQLPTFPINENNPH